MAEISLPVLDQVDNRTTEQILTAPELIDQTAAYIQSFRAAADSGQLPVATFHLLCSCLPVGVMQRDIWPRVYPDLPMPFLGFINIGRQIPSAILPTYDSVGQLLHVSTERPTIKSPSPEQIRHRFSGKFSPAGKIWLVDEWSETGDTLSVAVDVFQAAFPDAEITPRVVYTKRPHWSGQPSYLGITEPAYPELEKYALKIANLRHGTGFADEQEMLGSQQGQMVRQTFLNCIDRFNRSVFGVIRPENLDSEIFALARKERRVITSAVVSKILGSDSG